ncbi:putative DNA polymerase A.1 [Bacillus phage phiAGATE]|uniref:DNA polymerase A.1 n=1 Tax=Bacillus phage phiAGATE TaxID=1204533 RepID=L0L9A7_9CAUD|nr:DNA polymerase [Bacillus phage phiAGATE]AGB62743.1 putative DNA polymerase A.1 [Bacillus phage phiAGATE]
MKVLFLQEHLRENHIKKTDQYGGFKNVFLQTEAGKILRALAENPDGLALTKNDYYIDYAYEQIPQVLQRDKYNRATKYKKIGVTEAKKEYPFLYERIVREKPDIIVPTGAVGLKALTGGAKIGAARGVPVKVTITAGNNTERKEFTPELQSAYEAEHTQLAGSLQVAEEQLEYFLKAYQDRLKDSNSLQKELNSHHNTIDQAQQALKELDNRYREYLPQSEDSSHTCWVLPMYSIEYMMVVPNIQNFVQTDFVTLQKFLEKGEEAFNSKPVDYEHVESIERVREIFNKEIPNAPIVSWDLETNTLRPEVAGAKPLVISLSWAEGTGVTIPLEHKEFTWLPGHLAEIYQYIQAFVASPDIVKVGHNLQFDVRFLRLTKGFDDFHNNRDTKIMYWLLVSQDSKVSRQLSDITYEFTDMGGYDKPLEDYKVEYQRQWKAEEAARIKAAKAEHKDKEAQMKAEYKEQVKLERENARRENRSPVDIPEPVFEKIDFGKATERANEIDGSDFNYEWFPLKEILSPYASGDVDVCLRVHNKLDAVGQLPENQKIRYLYTQHYPEMTDALAYIEANGIKMDIEYVEQIINSYTAEEERLLAVLREFPLVKRLENELQELYEIGIAEWSKPPNLRDKDKAKLRDKYKDPEDRIFSPNSSLHKQKVLLEYTGIKLPFNKEYLVKSAAENDIQEDEVEWHHYKVDTKATLPYLKDHVEELSEMADLLLTHSAVKTRKQNFTYKLLALKDANDIVHGGFNSTGTATTRLSSSKPNMQQLPRKVEDIHRFDYKNPIKRMFVTSFADGALLQLDYSSLEARILALAAGDNDMTQAFLDGADPHRETAALVFNVPPEEVTGDQRSTAKATTFGLAYGKLFAVVKRGELTNVRCLQNAG